MSEKTEPASDKKLDDAREKGQIAQSKDLASAFALCFGLAALSLTASTIADRVRNIIATSIASAANPAGDSLIELQARALAMGIDALWAVGPVIGAVIVGSLVGGATQVGVNISFEPLTPKFDKLDPVSGAKKIFSLRSLFEVFKSIVKVVFIGWVLYALVRSVTPMMVRTTYGSADSIGASAWSAILWLLSVCAVLSVVLGVVDYVVQRLLFLKEQKMSKDEVKREYKQSEGDPQLKGERKALAQEIAFSDPAPAVAGANVVVVNPTHYAVALRYEPGEYGLPIIVAKGVDDEAAHIRALARQHDVPIIGNPALARALHKVPVRQPVPETLLEPVAIVLRWAAQLSSEESSA